MWLVAFLVLADNDGCNRKEQVRSAKIFIVCQLLILSDVPLTMCINIMAGKDQQTRYLLSVLIC